MTSKSEARKSGLRLAFEEMDKKCNGKVTIEQLRKAQEDNGCEWDLLDEARFKLIDTDEDGKIALNGTVQKSKPQFKNYNFYSLISFQNGSMHGKVANCTNAAAYKFKMIEIDTQKKSQKIFENSNETFCL